MTHSIGLNRSSTFVAMVRGGGYVSTQSEVGEEEEEVCPRENHMFDRLAVMGSILSLELAAPTCPSVLLAATASIPFGLARI